MSISHPIALYLNREHAVYSTLAHERAFTAQREAAVTRVPGRHWAKSVVCIVDEAEPVLAVVPADLIVNMKALLRLTSGRRVRLATEDEVESLFPECEVGAMPPFGSLYGLRTFVDITLASEPDIVFNGGTYTDAICMDYGTFADLVRPVEASFASWR